MHQFIPRHKWESRHLKINNVSDDAEQNDILSSIDNRPICGKYGGEGTYVPAFCVGLNMGAHALWAFGVRNKCISVKPTLKK